MRTSSCQSGGGIRADGLMDAERDSSRQTGKPEKEKSPLLELTGSCFHNSTLWFLTVASGVEIKFENTFRWKWLKNLNCKAGVSMDHLYCTWVFIFLTTLDFYSQHLNINIWTFCSSSFENRLVSFDAFEVNYWRLPNIKTDFHLNG